MSDPKDAQITQIDDTTGAGAQSTDAEGDNGTSAAVSGDEPPPPPAQDYHPEHGPGSWVRMKQWIRDEIDHARAGHSRETRETLNP